MLFVLSHIQDFVKHLRHEFAAFTVIFAQQVLGVDFEELAVSEGPAKPNGQLVGKCSAVPWLAVVDILT